MSSPDARELNWRFVLPDEPAGLLLLGHAEAGRHRSLAEAVDHATAAGVVVLDVSEWAARVSGRSVLRDAAQAVAPGGWLCVSFPNRLFPGATTARGAMALHTARATLRAAGLVPRTVYLPLPDHRHPALLVDARLRGQLDYVFEHLFVSYVPGSSFRVRLIRRVLVAVRRTALVMPQWLRVACAPGYCVLAWRPRD
jgi:SAM-dependent methyltransferase